MRNLIKLFFFTVVGTAFSQSIPIAGDQYHLYGPNSNWGAYLKVGGNGRGTTNASVVSTNGNLHLDSKDGYGLYLNYYSLGNTYINSQGGFVGIGTTAPSEKLEVNGNIRITDNKSFLFGNSGTASASIKLGSDDVLRFYNSDNEEKINFPVGGGDSRIVLQPNSGFVGIGTTTPDEKLAVNGNIHTKEVRVDLIGWSDFVFNKNYDLPSLKEVEQHIKDKGHLKDIPSAEEVKTNGIFLGDMNTKLLQKIEELTLYTIQQEKVLESHKKEIKASKNETTLLKEELKNQKIINENLETRLQNLGSLLNSIKQ